MELVTSAVFAPGQARGADPTAGVVGSDQILLAPHLGLLAVAEASAGGPDGRVGARLALDVIRTHIERDRDVLARFRRHPGPELRGRVLEALEGAFARAAHEVFAFARRRPEVRISLDALLLLDSEAFVAHAGDGRVYLVRRGVVHQLTVDPARGDEILQFGEPRTEGEPLAPNDGALGAAPRVKVESLCTEIATEDRFVVCGAGLHRAVPDTLLHARFAGEHLDRLGEVLAADAGGQPVLAACAQIGSGSPFTADLARARLALLAPMQLFAHCTERELRIVAQATHPRRLGAGTVVFEEGQPGNELYLVITGRIEVIKNGRPIATLPAGSVFGEMAMLDEPNRSATARTVEDTELMVITRESFFPMLRAHPPLAVKILWNLSLRLSASLRQTSARAAALERL